LAAAWLRLRRNPSQFATLVHRSRGTVITLRGADLVEIRNHRFAGGLEISPLIGIRKRGNGDRLAAVEAGERGIDQFINFHESRKLIPLLTGVFPDLGPRCRRKHRLNVNALRPKFSVKTLA